MRTLLDFANQIFGTETSPEDLSILHLCARGILIFLVTLALVRLGTKRLLSKNTPIDFIMAIILGSTLSRAINGGAPLFSTIGAALLLVLIHRGLAHAAVHSRFVGKLVKGHPGVLIKDGTILESALRAHGISHGDLMEQMRLKASSDNPHEFREVTLERNGEMSFLRR